MARIKSERISVLEDMEKLEPSYMVGIQNDAATLENSLAFPQYLNLGGFPGGAVVENLPANAGDTGSSPGLGRSHMPRSN